MHLVYCIPQLYRAGGMERVLCQKANEWVSRQHRVTIVTTESVPEGHRRCFFPLDRRVEVVELNVNFDADFHRPLLIKAIRHGRKQRHYRKALLRLLNERKVDCCISMGGKELEWLGEIDLPCRRLVELHMVHNDCSRLLRLYHSGRCWQWMGRYLDAQRVRQVRRVGELVVLNPAEQQWWCAQGVRQVHLIPNACSLPLGREELLRQKIVLAVGRLYPVKGFDLLLRAWSRIHSRYPDWQLHIVGEGEQREELEQRTDCLGIHDSVRFQGRVDAIDEQYRRSRIFVLSSRSECYPMALMEAMSQGCCAISFDCPNGPREMIEDRQTGRLVPPEDIDKLAAVLAEQMQDIEGSEAMGKRAAEYARQHWTPSVVMAQWKTILKTETDGSSI